MREAVTRPRRLLAVGLCSLALVGTMAVPMVAAAGPTQVTVSPTDITAETGSEVTVDIVVEQVDGGVGAWNVSLTVANPDVADITDVTFHGDPGLTDVSMGPDNDTVTFDAALADTKDTGSVVIATITLQITSGGVTNLDATINALGDEQGNSYSVTGVADSELSTPGATATGTATATSSDGGSQGGEQTPTATDATGGSDSSGSGGGTTTTTTSETEPNTATTGGGSGNSETTTKPAQTDSAAETTSSSTDAAGSDTGTGEASSPSTSLAEGSETTSPGFGVVVGLISMVLAAGLFGRRNPN